MERSRPRGRLLLGLRFAVVAAALLKLALLYAQNDRLTRSVTCLRAQLHDYAKSGQATDLKACGVSDAIDAAPSKEACAAGTDAATATEDEAEAFTAPRLATLAATLVCVFASAVALRHIDALLPPRDGHRASERLAYRIDCWFSSNPNAKILALLYVSIAMVLVGGLLLYGVSSTGFGDAIWENVALVGIDFTAASATESSLMARVVAVASALGGMFITALLLGIVSDAVGDYVDDLKKGKSDVLETNHTLVLGWSDPA